MTTRAPRRALFAFWVLFALTLTTDIALHLLSAGLIPAGSAKAWSLGLFWIKIYLAVSFFLCYKNRVGTVLDLVFAPLLSFWRSLPTTQFLFITATLSVLFYLLALNEDPVNGNWTLYQFASSYFVLVAVFLLCTTQGNEYEINRREYPHRLSVYTAIAFPVLDLISLGNRLRIHISYYIIKSEENQEK